MNGDFVWYDLMTTSPADAQAFYGAVLGWTAQESGVAGMTYNVLSVGETGFGGVMALSAEALAGGARPGWLGYIGASDVDESATRVKQAGGTVHRPPQDIPGVGRFAVVADPHGAVFMLFKGAGPMPPPPADPNAPGLPGWRELHAGDGVSDFDFYSGLFGWTKDQAMDMGPMGVYQIFAINGVARGGVMTKTAEMPAPAWIYYFNADEIDDAAGRVTANGGTILNGPHEVPGGMWIVQCLDPQGALFALVGPRR
ncbi:MAG: hypothetical protein JWN93_3990 [Hyphomicrobiales bacterium]|nr:hypothetical protein [Hyphomicrobiales bacterium]